MLPVCNRWMWLGRLACRKLWSKAWPEDAKIKHSRFSGSFAASNFGINRLPNFKDFKLAGKATSSQLWWKLSPKVSSSRLSGKATCWRAWSKSSPKVRVLKFFGSFTHSKPQWHEHLHNPLTCSKFQFIFGLLIAMCLCFWSVVFGSDYIDIDCSNRTLYNIHTLWPTNMEVENRPRENDLALQTGGFHNHVSEFVSVV